METIIDEERSVLDNILTDAALVVRSRAPVRIDFAGGWTDVALFTELEPGAVVSAAIGVYSYVSAQKLPPKQVKSNAYGYRHTEEMEDKSIRIYSADFQYTAGKFDLLGAVAHTQIDGAKKIGNGTAEEIFGWYLEGAYHIMPDEWKKGKLAKSDAVVFLRYDDFDTQYRMPDGVSRNPAGDRTEWTIGAAFWPTPNFVIKADYQIPDDATGDDLGHKINLGIGFAF